MSAHRLLVTDDGRLRAAWRIALFILVSLATFYVVWPLAGTALRFTSVPTDPFVVSSYVTLLTGLVAHGVALQWIEPGRSWSFVGLARSQAAPRRLALGLLFGALAIGVPSTLLLLAGELRIQHTPDGSWWEAAWRATVILLPAALVEELFLRGYLFSVLHESAGWRWTLVGTSVAFGLLHLDNPGVTPEAILLVIIAGFFLGGIRLATDSLYAAWMAHFAWNWVMAGALHTAVSGLGVSTPDYQTISVGPAWLTGGAWGPEGGAAAGVSMLAFVFFFYARYFKHLPPRQLRTSHLSQPLSNDQIIHD